MKNLTSILLTLLAVCIWFGALYFASEIVIASYQRAELTGATLSFYITALIVFLTSERVTHFAFNLCHDRKEVEA